MIAKDTIDILVENPDNDKLNNSIIEKMKHIGYDFIMQADALPPYMVFVKGYNNASAKEQTYHLPMAPKNHSVWERFFFRDFLIEHPDIANQYEKLKLRLAKIS